MSRRGQTEAAVLIALSLLIFLIGVFNVGNVVFVPTVLLDIDKVGTVGRGESNIRHIPFGNTEIEMTEAAAPTIEEKGPITLARGLITSEEHETAVSLTADELGSISSTKISFKVLKTNQYGTMTVKLNGRLIWSGSPTEGETVDIDLAPFKELFMVGENSVVFSTTSSGWRIWAPAIYVIESIKAEANILKTSQKSFEFGVTEGELNNWMLGRVVFTVEDAAVGTDLFVKINNFTVWRGSPKPGNLPTLVDFSKMVTGLGTSNTLAFGVEQSGRYNLKNIDVLVFNSGEGTSASTITFNVAQENLEALRQGKLRGVVEVDVLSIEKEGDLGVSIIGEDEYALMNRPVGVGKIELAFTDREVRSGTNIITLKSTGLYDVGELKIMLVNR